MTKRSTNGRSKTFRLALPAAEKHGVSILMENVWNDFLYDHEGGDDQSAERLAKFVDDFDSPYVGVQFDIGNHWKYGDPAKWIRTLGRPHQETGHQRILREPKVNSRNHRGRYRLAVGRTGATRHSLHRLVGRGSWRRRSRISDDGRDADGNWR